jgi:amidase
VHAAIEVLVSQGATRVDVHLPDFDEAVAMWMVICSAEAALAHEDTYPSKKDSYGPWFQSFLDIGHSVTGSDYASANNVRNAIRGRMGMAMAEADVVACPGLPFPAFPVTRELLYGPMIPPEDGDPTSIMMRYTVPADFTGQPTLSMPCGFSSDGLPLSLQLMGHHWQEDLLCRAGFAYQSATDWHERHPEV